MKINYVNWINSNKERRAKMRSGYLIYNDAFGISENFYKCWNDYVDDYDVFKFISKTKIDINNYYKNPELKFLDDILRQTQYIDNYLANFKSDLSFSLVFLKRDFKYMNKRLKNSKKKDNKKNDEIIETNRMNDLSFGIFSHEEANNRFFYNKFINYYVSNKTRDLITKNNSKTKQIYTYIYIKLEEVLFAGYICLKQKKDFLNWSEKNKIIKKIIDFDDKQSETITKIISVSNYIKHQKELGALFSWPSIKESEELILFIFNEISKKINYSLFIDAVNNLNSEISAIVNPLGLTGLE